jgi:hypothetical protein
MTKFLGVLLICLLAIPSLAQPSPDTLWTRTYGGSSYDEAQCVQQTADGGYIVAGSTWSSGLLQFNFWLIKTDASGDSVWSRIFGGTSDEYCFSVQQTFDDGYVLAGWTESFGAGSRDFWLVKTNTNGDSLWSRTFGGASDDECTSVEQTSDGGYMLAGSTGSFGAGVYDFWLVKTDGNGNLQWSRTFGGGSEDRCYSAQQTADGGCILAGYTRSFGAGQSDF